MSGKLNNYQARNKRLMGGDSRRAGEVTILMGLQWGDEGKGKLSDALCADIDVAVRYQGGHNAGHTVSHGNKRYKLHLLPCGILRESVHCVIANGVALSLDALQQEISILSHISDIKNRLSLSAGCPLLLPTHKALDEAREKNSLFLGTTKRGIGPAYEDFYARRALLLGDIFSQDFDARLAEVVDYHNFLLKRRYAAPELSAAAIAKDIKKCAEEFKDMVKDTTTFLNDAKKEGRSILLEGAQGCSLDIYQGTYPFVTSSSPSIGGALNGCGFSHKDIDRVLGVTKAYATRVGEGPFPTEQKNEIGKKLQTLGNEFGATTGRQRRCGWLDLVDVQRASRMNGVDALFLTKVDVLDTFEHIQVCVKYSKSKEPVYAELTGWQQDTSAMRVFNELPPQLHTFIELVEGAAGAPVEGLSVGMGREQLIMRE